MAEVQNGPFFASDMPWKPYMYAFRLTSGMHPSVHIFQGRGGSHWKTVPDNAATAQRITRPPIITVHALCIVRSASRWRKSRIEHFAMLIAKIESIFAANILIRIRLMSIKSKRQFRLPRPECTAVETIRVPARAHADAVRMMASSNGDRERSLLNTHRKITRAAVQIACYISQC